MMSGGVSEAILGNSANGGFSDADLLATLDLGTSMARSLNGIIEYWSHGCTRLYGYSVEEAVGRRCHELLKTTFPVPLAEVDETLLASAEWEGDLQQVTKDGRIVIVSAKKFLRRRVGSDCSVLEALTDVTRHRLESIKLLESRALLDSITENASGLIYAKDRDGRILFVNSAALAVIGCPKDEVQGKTDSQFLANRAQADAVMANDLVVLKGGQSQQTEETVDGRDGKTRVFLSQKSPRSNGMGEVIGLVGFSMDITHMKRHEDHMQRMIDELNHRVKNTLATVQSIAFRTFFKVERDLYEAFSERLLALTAIHDVLTDTTWTSATLLQVIECIIAPHGGMADQRFHVDGPPLELRPSAAIALSIGMHELLTNALKYGALSNDAGRVKIGWHVSQDGLNLILTWSEFFGPAVLPPSERGIGSNVLEKLVASDIGGSCKISFDPTGVVCLITAPLREISAVLDDVSFPRVRCPRGSSEWH